MGIFEIVFPKVKEGSALRQELFERLPLLGPTTFQGAPGLRGVYRAKVLDSVGPTAQGHPGFMPMPRKFSLYRQAFTGDILSTAR